MGNIHWTALIIIILVLDLFAIYSDSEDYTVSGLISSGILEENYVIEGTVTEVLEDHMSGKGFRYSQFMVSDGSEEIKFFCSRQYGSVEVKEGDLVRVEGELVNYYGELELSGFCSEIEILS
jgi:predicted extracellular nuclease